MHDVMYALNLFFAHLGVPAHPAGLVPPGASLPIVTWEAAAGCFGESLQITATAWFDGPDANILRAAYLDSVLDALPESGLRLPCRRGFLLLERGSDMLRCISDPAHPGLAGGRIRLTLRRYGAT